jgi:hypothetical protein
MNAPQSIELKNERPVYIELKNELPGVYRVVVIMGSKLKKLFHHAATDNKINLLYQVNVQMT